MEIIIKGAGLSGLTAAITLAKSGFKPIVVEKRGSVGGQFKITVQSIKNYDYLFDEDVVQFFKTKLDLDIDNSYCPIDDFIRISSSNNMYTTRNKRPPVMYNFLRGSNNVNSLDNKLLYQAKRLGVQINYNCDSSLKKYTIDASGSKTPKFIGFGKTYKKPSDFDNKNLVYFNYNILPEGYAYIVPYKNVVTKSIFLPINNRKSSLITLYEKVFREFDRNFNENKLTLISQDSGFGYYDILKSYNVNGTYLCGTAAGLMTADYGFAIFNSIFSGYLAAKAISQNLDYNELIQKNILPYIEKSYLDKFKMKFTSDKILNKKFSSNNNQIKIVENCSYSNNTTDISLILNKIALFILKNVL